MGVEEIGEVRQLVRRRGDLRLLGKRQRWL
jgi:hypothetical protein